MYLILVLVLRQGEAVTAMKVGAEQKCQFLPWLLIVVHCRAILFVRVHYTAHSRIIVHINARFYTILNFCGLLCS